MHISTIYFVKYLHYERKKRRREEKRKIQPPSTLSHHKSTDSLHLLTPFIQFERTNLIQFRRKAKHFLTAPLLSTFTALLTRKEEQKGAGERRLVAADFDLFD